jgi:hypothetical protein
MNDLLDLAADRHQPLRRIAVALVALSILPALAAASEETSFATANSAALSASQWAAYRAEVPKSIIELQPFRRTVTEESAVAGRDGSATLVDLSPNSNAWFLLSLRRADTGLTVTYHLENPRPGAQTLTLEHDGIRIAEAGRTLDCNLWSDTEQAILKQAQGSDLPYAPLCAGRLYLRNVVSGTYTHLERVTNFLRDDIWGGERIVGFVKKEFFADAFLEHDASATERSPQLAAGGSRDGPSPPLTGAAFAADSVTPEHLGVDVGQGSGALDIGRWYPVRDAPGIYLSVFKPEDADASVSVRRKTVNPLDAVEAGAADYLIAMNLGRFDLAFALGTDHPRVEWSPRALNSVRDVRLAGPDGIGSVTPLVGNGIVNPATVESVAVSFAGGFKREHGAFHTGTLALQNHGSHYGFIEQGVVFSKLQPGLATLLVMDDGQVRMKTWVLEDGALLPHIRFARQNGVPLIDYDELRQLSSPGALVGNWAAGNWSGSDDERLRTLRAGICLQVSGKLRYLIFGYFSTATPSAMVRVFQAYGCRYAMHLDMNALEHTYFALYTIKGGRIVVQHLIDGMSEVDRKGGSELAPRFLSFPDNRDFFYLTRKQAAP